MGMTRTEATEHRIHAASLARLQEQFGRLNRRAQRLGVSGLSIEEAGRSRTWVWTRLDHQSGGDERIEMPDGQAPSDDGWVREQARDYVHISVAGERPHLDGWRFLGVLKHTDDPSLG